MKDWKFNYPNLFWEEDNEYIKNLTPRKFREYLDNLRCSDNMKSNSKLREIIRKMVERGSCFEGTLFLTKDEVRGFLENEKIWFLDERREPLWKDYANLPQSYPLKRMRDGNLPRNARPL